MSPNDLPIVEKSIRKIHRNTKIKFHQKRDKFHRNSTDKFQLFGRIFTCKLWTFVASSRYRFTIHKAFKAAPALTSCKSRLQNHSRSVDHNRVTLCSFLIQRFIIAPISVDRFQVFVGFKFLQLLAMNQRLYNRNISLESTRSRSFHCKISSRKQSARN